VSEHFNLLIAEDDQLLAASLKLMIPNSFRVFIVKRPEDVPNHIFFHAAFVDMHLNQSPAQGPDGVHVIKKLVLKNPHTEIVAMSGEINRPVMDAALHAGAQRFLAKPLMSEEVTLVLEKILAYWQLRELSFSASNHRSLVGSSATTEFLRKKISSLKNETAPVLIEGETGTGRGKTPFYSRQLCSYSRKSI
jgi:DNA-binding NtrC family response regulator